MSHHKFMAIYTKLKVGDMRKLGDQTRKRWNLTYADLISNAQENPEDTPWIEVSLIGWAILPADLFNAEFRRRII